MYAFDTVISYRKPKGQKIPRKLLNNSKLLKKLEFIFLIHTFGAHKRTRNGWTHQK